MILFFEYGRLGNQLFQYVGIKRYFSDHKIVFFGCEDLAETMETVDVKFIAKNQLPKWLRLGILYRLANLASRLLLVGSVWESRKEFDYAAVLRKGLMLGVYLLRRSYFQHERVISEIPADLRLKPNLVEQANAWLADRLGQFTSRPLVFVHVRRGDYLTWPSAEFPAILDLAWYRRAMALARNRTNKPLFLILTDDPYYAEDVFSDEDDTVISNNGPLVDFALMSQCQHGILSASSFAWWGAWFSRQDQKKNKKSFYFAPDFWAGHRRKQWYPEGFKADWITYIE
jgi:hypothetical protein